MRYLIIFYDDDYYVGPFKTEEMAIRFAKLTANGRRWKVRNLTPIYDV